MKTNKIFAVIATTTLLAVACALTATPAPAIPVTGTTPTPEPIGLLNAEEMLVEYGPIEGLAQVTTTETFFNNYSVRVTNGGVAKLDFFVNQISIRLFNDTAIGDVKADPSGTADRAVRMKLMFGGLSGQVTKDGIPVQFEVANGVTVYILGTQFIVLYDIETGATYIGNFDGTVAFTTPAQPSVQFIQPGQIYEFSPSFETRAMVMNFTRADIDSLTSTRRSTLLITLREFLDLTATPTPTVSTPTLSPTATSTATPFSTITPSPTDVIACDRAAFVADVSVPDGTSFPPGFQFTKIWRLRNVGTCTWTNNYSLMFYRGEQMGGPGAVNIPSTVAPGQTVDIPVSLVAPTLPGSHRGEWILRNASGAQFGVGANGMNSVWVTVNVTSTATITVATVSPGAITGTAFSDYNGNEIPDTGEIAQGLTVTLYDSTGSTALTSRVTDTNGRYTFPNLSPGTYYVKWVMDGCSGSETREEIVSVNAGSTQTQNLSTFVLC